MTTTRSVVHDTYVRTKPPVLDLTARTIRFNFALYLIPVGVPIESMYDAIVDAIAHHSIAMLSAAILPLQPYKVQEHVKPSWRQTEIYDPFDRAVVQ